MSIKKLIRFEHLVFVALGIALGVGIKSYMGLLSSRDPIQIASNKRIGNFNSGRTIAKANGLFQIQLQPKKKKAIKPGDSAEFLATIQSNDDVGQLNVRWVLQSGLKHVSGPAEPTFFHISKGDSITVTIEVERTEDPQGILNVEAYTIESDGTRIGAAESISTDTLEADSNELAKTFEYQRVNATPERIMPKIQQ